MRKDGLEKENGKVFRRRKNFDQINPRAQELSREKE